MFLGWHDPSKQPIDRKVADALERYRSKFRREPDTVLVTVAEAAAVQGAFPALTVRGETFIPANVVYVGREERGLAGADGEVALGPPKRTTPLHLALTRWSRGTPLVSEDDATEPAGPMQPTLPGVG